MGLVVSVPYPIPVEGALSPSVGLDRSPDASVLRHRGRDPPIPIVINAGAPETATLDDPPLAPTDHTDGERIAAMRSSRSAAGALETIEVLLPPPALLPGSDDEVPPTPAYFSQQAGGCYHRLSSGLKVRLERCYASSGCSSSPHGSKAHRQGQSVTPTVNAAAHRTNAEGGPIATARAAAPAAPMTRRHNAASRKRERSGVAHDSAAVQAPPSGVASPTTMLAVRRIRRPIPSLLSATDVAVRRLLDGDFLHVGSSMGGVVTSHFDATVGKALFDVSLPPSVLASPSSNTTVPLQHEKKKKAANRRATTNGGQLVGATTRSYGCVPAQPSYEESVRLAMQCSQAANDEQATRRVSVVLQDLDEASQGWMRLVRRCSSETVLGIPDGGASTALSAVTSAVTFADHAAIEEADLSQLVDGVLSQASCDLY